MERPLPGRGAAVRERDAGLTGAIASRLAGSAGVYRGRGNGLLATSNGVELPLLYASNRLSLTGPGAYSLDAAFGLLGLWTPALSVGVLIMGVGAAGASLLLHRPEEFHAHA